MSKILITGMSASHMSQTSMNKSLGFAGAISKVLESAKHDVLISPPDITWKKEYLDNFDAVLVGVSPITSLSANKAYGALHVIDLLWGSEKLNLFIDAPHPALITASLRSLDAKPENLVKPFYAYRAGYKVVSDKEQNKRYVSIVRRFLTDAWPATLYPSLPWRNGDSVAATLPETAHARLSGINLDSYLIADAPPTEVERVLRWAADYPESPWSRKTLGTLHYPAVMMKSHKGWSDSMVEDNIAHSIGSLISPHRDGTWWTYRYIQSMNTGTPIATQWRESAAIGGSWSVLASAIESMNPNERRDISWNQTSEYMRSIPTRDEAKVSLEGMINLGTKTKKGSK
jgi:hypothetical protein